MNLAGRSVDIDTLFKASFILLAVLPIFMFIHVGLYLDESNFLFIGDSINHGSTLYKDITDNKPPGIFYLSALIFSAFGKSIYVPRIMLFIFNALSGLILYFIGKNLWNKRVGQLSSILFLGGIYNPFVAGYYVLTEQFLIFFGMLGIFIFFKSNHWTHLLLAGALFGIAALFKQSGILFLIVISMYYFLQLRFNENRTEVYVSRSLRSLFLIGCGFSVPIFIAVLYFYSVGALNDFIYWSFLFYAEGGYMGSGSIDPQFVGLVMSLLIIWLPALAFAAILIKDFITRRSDNYNLFSVIWLFVFIYTLTVRQFGHYFIQILPPACLLAAVSLIRLSPLFHPNSIKNMISRKDAIKLFTTICIIGMVLPGIFVYMYWEHSSSGIRNQDLKDQMQASDFIASHTSPDEKVLSYPYDPSIYLLSDRNPPTKYLLLNGPLIGADEEYNIIDKLNKSHIRYVVIGNNRIGRLAHILGYYRKETTIGAYDIYKRRDGI